MELQFGLETEIGIARDRDEEIDVVAESIALVRSAKEPGVRMCWDYSYEDPHMDARGFRVQELRQDTDEAHYFAQDAQRKLSFTEIKSDLVLRNGARFYNDHAHPEYCTPECSTLLEILQQDYAGDALLMACAATVERASGEPVRLYKNNTDFRGHSYGCHENYLMPRRLPWHELAAGVQAFLATRQIFAGAGKFGWEAEDEYLRPGFQISQRSDFFSVLQSVDTMQRRPLVNTRDEPHADTERYRRFHVIIGDTNLSLFSTYLKLGSTALVLQAFLNGAPMHELPRLADPLDTLKSVSRDTSWKWICRLADGSLMSAVDIQRKYLEIARRYAGAEGDEWLRAMADWGEVLNDLEKDPLLTADRLDWSAKFRLVEEFRQHQGVEPGDSWLQSLDLAYHLLDRSEGLFFGLMEQGALRLPYPLKEIRGRGLEAPATTRAAVRGACVERFGGCVESAQWDGLVLKSGQGRIEVNLRNVFDRDEIYAAVAAIRKAEKPEDLLPLRFTKLL